MKIFLLACFGIFILLKPSQAISFESNLENELSIDNSIELPEALSEDDSFYDLPFEQLRQALREEVEYGPKSKVRKRDQKRYNFFIR